MNQEIFPNGDFWTQPVGNGPYRYVRHVPKTMMELEANPDYYAAPPAIERVVIKFGVPNLTELLKVFLAPPDEAMEQADLAVTMDPPNSLIRALTCVTLSLVDRNKKAIARCDETLRADPTGRGCAGPLGRHRCIDPGPREINYRISTPPPPDPWVRGLLGCARVGGGPGRV